MRRQAALSPEQKISHMKQSIYQCYFNIYEPSTQEDSDTYSMDYFTVNFLSLST